MKIAFFVSSFPVISETFIANQVIALRQSGHLVHIYSQHRPTNVIVHKMIIDAGLPEVTFYLDDIPKQRLYKIITLFKKGFRQLFSPIGKVLFNTSFDNTSRLSVYNLIPFFGKPNYNVLHAHFGVNGNYVCELRRLGLFKHARFITTFHGYDLMFESCFYKELFDSDVFITVNSEYSKNQLIKLNSPLHKVQILPVGLNTKYFTRKETNNKTFTLLFVGRLVEFKGPDIFLEICKELANRNKIIFRAFIVGDGVLKNQLEKKIDSFQLNSIVELVGSKTQEEIKLYMEKSDVFILPGITHNNRSENQGLVIQEAQAMQIPVIISDAGGMSEGIIDGITGFVVIENAVDQFVQKVELLALDKLFRNKMGYYGRKFVQDKYDVEKLNMQLLELYERRLDK